MARADVALDGPSRGLDRYNPGDTISAPLSVSLAKARAHAVMLTTGRSAERSSFAREKLTIYRVEPPAEGALACARDTVGAAEAALACARDAVRVAEWFDGPAWSVTHDAR